MSTPTVYIVGADKGGVGKTLVSRTILDYLKANAIENRAFDTEDKTADGRGVLKRFFPDRTSIVDLTDSDDQIKVFDTLGSPVTVIDIRAGLLTETLTLLKEIGFLDPAKMKLVVLHVLGNNQASVGEVKSITEALSSARYIAIGNHVNKTKFSFPEGALDIPVLDTLACEDVDANDASFTAYANGDLSAVLRGKVRHWLGLVFAQYDAAKLNAVA
jgi:hypothetical protein